MLIIRFDAHYLQGGACAALGFEPPAGYWCNPDPPRGQGYSTKFPASLGYDPAAFEGRTWASWKPNQTVVNAFRSGHWCLGLFPTISRVLLSGPVHAATRSPCAMPSQETARSSDADWCWDCAGTGL